MNDGGGGCKPPCLQVVEGKGAVDGQRRAAIIGGWISAVIIAAALIAMVKGDAFLRGLGITIGVTALLIEGSGLSLALRDERGLAVLLAGPPATIAAETERMATFVKNYRYYRAAFLAIATLGLILPGLRSGPLCDDIAVGLLMLAAIGLTIDHYDRQFQNAVIFPCGRSLPLSANRAVHFGAADPESSDLLRRIVSGDGGAAIPVTARNEVPPSM